MLPLKTKEYNVVEKWQDRVARHTKQKYSILYVMNELKDHVKMPCTLTFKRYGKKLLDAHDNLSGSFKHIVDHVCACITGDKRPGRADGHPGFTFKYEQEKSKEYFIKVTIDF